MHRFVILHHRMPRGSSRSTHWDFMLEHDGVLLTWAIDEALEVGANLVAQRLADHRLAYLTYEGPVSGDRGDVVQWDRGTYETIAWSKHRIDVRLIGEQLHATATLERYPGNEEKGESDQRWTLSLSVK